MELTAPFLLALVAAAAAATAGLWAALSPSPVHSSLALGTAALAAAIVVAVLGAPAVAAAILFAQGGLAAALLVTGLTRRRQPWRMGRSLRAMAVAIVLGAALAAGVAGGAESPRPEAGAPRSRGRALLVLSAAGFALLAGAAGAGTVGRPREM